MRLDTIEVTDFKSIRELKLKLRRLNVLIGALLAIRLWAIAKCTQAAFQNQGGD